MKEFTEIKEMTINWAKNVNVCSMNYNKLEKAETFKELLDVFKSNFNWCCNHKFLESEILQNTELSILNENEIYLNQNCKNGYLVAYGNSTVEAYGNSTVKAWDNSYINVFSTIEVKLSDNAIARYQNTKTIKIAENSEYSIAKN